MNRYLVLKLPGPYKKNSGWLREGLASSRRPQAALANSLSLGAPGAGCARRPLGRHKWGAPSKISAQLTLAWNAIKKNSPATAQSSLGTALTRFLLLLRFGRRLGRGLARGGLLLPFLQPFLRLFGLRAIGIGLDQFP